MATNLNTIVIDLGPLKKKVDVRVESGSYANAEDVVRAGLLALEREEKAADRWLVELADETLADPRPMVSAEQVFRELRAKYGRPTKESLH
jgi:antitoxin ParD1/3/4